MIPPISSIPPLTEADKKTLEHLRGSEGFLIMVKLLAKEWHQATGQMLGARPEELLGFQGHARALVSVYNQLMVYSKTDVPEKPGEEADTPKPARKLHNLRDS